jgi:hypothetical protein
MTSVRPLAGLLRLGAGPLVWFAHFSLTYGAEVVVCRPPAPSPDTMLWFGAATTALALLVLGGLAITSRRRDATFLPGAALMLTGLAALGVIWTAVPLAILPACT